MLGGVAPQQEPATVLVVDDEEPIRRTLVRYLAGAGYHAIGAASAEAGLEAVRSHTVAAVLSDIRMPGMSGVDFLSRALAVDPDLAVIMLTGVDEPTTAIQCLRQGAADYLIKPVELEELGLALRYALRKRELEVERRGTEQWLADEVARKTRQLEEQQRRIEHLSISVLTALVDALEPAGPAGRTHSVRVSRLAGDIAAALGLDAEQVAGVQTAGRLHDIGHLALRDDTLKQHAAAIEIVGDPNEGEIAMRLLDPLRHHAALLAIVRYQHERWDGRGLHGLRGAGIPMGARIVAVANLYDELVSPAEGGAGLEPLAALTNLQGLAGTLLDADVLQALTQVLAGGRAG
jgi:response regulator RpfG family c-di-GMP phosphodiesterase